MAKGIHGSLTGMHLPLIILFVIIQRTARAFSVLPSHSRYRPAFQKYANAKSGLSDMGCHILHGFFKHLLSDQTTSLPY